MGIDTRPGDYRPDGTAGFHRASEDVRRQPADDRRQLKQMEGFERMYDNPLMNAAITFTEPFPIGLLATLISAAVLKKRAATP